MKRDYKNLFKNWTAEYKESSFTEAVLFFKGRNIDIVFEKLDDGYFMWEIPQHNYSISGLGLSKSEIVAKKAAIDAAIYFFQQNYFCEDR